MLNNSPKKRTKTKVASHVKYVLNDKDSIPLKGWKIDSALDPHRSRQSGYCDTTFIQNSGIANHHG